MTNSAQQEDANTINGRILELIYLLRMTQNDFAGKMGVNSSTLAHIVGPRQSKPGYEFIYRLLKTYKNVNPNWLILNEGEAFLKTESNVSIYKNVKAITHGQGSNIIQDIGSNNENSDIKLFSSNPTNDIDVKMVSLKVENDTLKTKISILESENHGLKETLKAKEELLQVYRENKRG